jgi:hypothetical protein
LNIRDNIALLVTWVEEYYGKLKKTSTFGGKKYSYYGSLRGYFKHSSVLTESLEKELFGVEYKIWFRMLTNVKSGHNVATSGGLFLGMRIMMTYVVLGHGKRPERSLLIWRFS